jgi:hypothetical protein
MGRQSHASKRVRDTSLIHGLAKHGIRMPRIGSMTSADIVKLLHDHLDALDARDAAAATYADCVKRERVLENRIRGISGSVKALAHAVCGEDPSKLGDFGLLPYKKTGPKTPEVVKQSIAKAQATRKARFTMGKRQKKAIKGAPSR